MSESRPSSSSYSKGTSTESLDREDDAGASGGPGPGVGGAVEESGCFDGGLSAKDDDTASRLTMCALTVGFCGAQIAWGVQNSIATPTFRELGMSPSHTALIWLAGPISGIVVQPVVGQWSDRCTSRLGRRRPFILASTALICATMLVFGSARQLAPLLASQAGAEPRAVAVALAVVAFWVMDFAINALQGPMRALAADAFPAEQQAAASGMFALHNGLGASVAFGLGSLDLEALSGGLSQVQALSTAAACLIALLSGCTLLSSRGRDRALPDGKPQGGAPHGVCGECRSQAHALVGTFRSLPALLQRVFAVQFLFSMGKNGAMIFATDWFGEVVYGGDPRGPPDSDSLARFHKGVRMGSLAMLGCGAMSGLFGLALPLMLRACRKQRLWAAALGFGAATMSAMALLHRPVGLAVALAVALGVALGARESIPWSVVTAVTKGTSSTGACTAMFNLSQAVPTLIPILTGSAVLQVASLSAVLGLCAVPMALSSALVLAVVPADLDAAELAAGSAMPGPVSPKEEA